MRLRFVAHKDYDNEANMRAQRDNILERLTEAGFTVVWNVAEE